MAEKFLWQKIGKAQYFPLFGVGRVCATEGGTTWVAFKGYRVAFDADGRHLEIQIG